jgi:hypothetical protein
LLLADDKSQKFDLATQLWSTVDTKFPPLQVAKFVSSISPVHSPGCLLLPNDEILVAGSGIIGFQKKAFIYNIQANRWRSLPDMIHDQGMPYLLNTNNFSRGLPVYNVPIKLN